MIVTNVCLLLEALSIVICLHHLYGEKFRLDIATVSFLSIDMIIMTAINYFGLPKTYTMVIYPVIILYCGVRFGFEIRKIAVNFILCIIIVGGIQSLIASPICYFLDMHNLVNIASLVIVLMVLVIVIFLVPLIEVKKITEYLQNKERELFIGILICVFFISSWLIKYKKINLVEWNNTIILFVCIAFILIMSVQLIKYKVKAKEAEAEIRIHKLYADSFRGLVDDIRLKQHEFDNHINAIYSLHYSCNTFEELVKAQNGYCEQVMKNNRFNKLLVSDNAVIRGFLYTRFVEIDRMGIDVSYQIILDEFYARVPIYKIVEVLGNLINNAVEAMETNKKGNKLHVEIIETEGFFIEVRNESPYIKYDVLGKFFNKGYSKKGENRGLGLYNVKKICDEYGLEIAPKWIEINGQGWLVFKIWNKN